MLIKCLLPSIIAFVSSPSLSIFYLETWGNGIPLLGQAQNDKDLKSNALFWLAEKCDWQGRGVSGPFSIAPHLVIWLLFLKPWEEIFPFPILVSQEPDLDWLLRLEDTKHTLWAKAWESGSDTIWRKSLNSNLVLVSDSSWEPRWI